MNDRCFKIRKANWTGDKAALRAVRRQVFVMEQLVPEELDCDDLDAAALHLLAVDNKGNPIGTARLLPSGQIGRMAVLKTWRGRGVGGALLSTLLGMSRSGNRPPPFLNAQVNAIGFYRRHGFRCSGDEFVEAGIVHRKMLLDGYD